MNSIQVMNQLQSQFGTSDWSKWNIYAQPFYDAVVYPGAGTTSLDFFALPAGATDSNGSFSKTAEDTNCTVPRQLGQNYLICTAIRCGVFFRAKSRQPNAIATDANLIYRTMDDCMNKYLELFNRGTLQINIDSKSYLTLDRPFIRAPYGAGLNLRNFASAGTSAPAVKSVRWIQNNPDEASVYVNTPPWFIAPNQIINASIQWNDGTGPVFTNLVDSATPSIQLRLMLDGFMVRASQ